MENGLGAGLGIVAILFFLAIFVFAIAAQWKVFEKAGKPGWAALVPIYGTIVFLEIVGKPTWWILVLIFVPILNIVYAVKAVHALSLSFGKDSGFTVGLIFLSIIFYAILGFGDAEYIGPGGEAAS